MWCCSLVSLRRHFLAFAMNQAFGNSPSTSPRWWRWSDQVEECITMLSKLVGAQNKVHYLLKRSWHPMHSRTVKKPCHWARNLYKTLNKEKHLVCCCWACGHLQLRWLCWCTLEFPRHTWPLSYMGMAVPPTALEGSDICKGQWSLPVEESPSRRQSKFFLSSSTTCLSILFSIWVKHSTKPSIWRW